MKKATSFFATMALFIVPVGLNAKSNSKGKLSRTTPVMKNQFTKGGATEGNLVCKSAFKGTEIEILKVESYFDAKIKLKNGVCAGKTGWVSTESIEQ